MKERLDAPPVAEQYTQTLALRNLLTAKGEDFRNLLTNKEFLFEFPSLAVYLIGSKGRAEVLEDQRAGLFSLSLSTFLSKNNRQLTGYSFTKDGEFVAGYNNEKERKDPAAKAILASILLIGMSITDKERQRALLVKSYQNLSQDSKVAFTDNFGRLLMQNNATRTWIKENGHDAENGFDWDHELAYALFFGIYASLDASHFYIPKEIQFQDRVNDYSSQTRGVMLDFALEYAEKLKKSKNNSALTVFIMQMEKMEMTENMREKLDAFKKAVNYRKAESPADPGSSLSGEVAYRANIYTK